MSKAPELEAVIARIQRCAKILHHHSPPLRIDQDPSGFIARLVHNGQPVTNGTLEKTVREAIDMLDAKLCEDVERRLASARCDVEKLEEALALDE